MPDFDDALAGTPWVDWQITPLAGDASARRFARLTGPDGDSAILMLTPPAEAASQTAFVRIARFLAERGYPAPRILRESGPAVLMTDLGQTDFATALDRSPSDAATLYAAATDILAALHAEAPPPDLSRLTPDRAAEMVGLAATHYARNPAAEAPLSEAMGDAFARLAPDPAHLALRDYHAENLIWRPDREGQDRIGLIDFQDAFLAPAGYDLASLLRDARRAVPEAIPTAMTRRFCEATGLAEEPFRAQLACLGAQRNLRILGVFARLSSDHGKTRYLPMLPLLWAHLQSDLAHPALSELARVVARHLSPPEPLP